MGDYPALDPFRRTVDRFVVRPTASVGEIGWLGIVWIGIADRGRAPSVSILGADALATSRTEKGATTAIGIKGLGTPPASIAEEDDGARPNR
jgi:hypothetical protein